MEQTITLWAATGLAAKTFADSMRKEHGFATPNVVARSPNATEIDALYMVMLVASMGVVRVAGAEAALLIAILMKFGKLANSRILIEANHSILELFVLVMLLRLLHLPNTLASVIQLLTLSVWLYSVFQKLYHRQFRDGSFFYLSFQNPGRSGRYARFMSRVSKIDGDYSSADHGGQAFCRRLALLVLAAETIFPLLALLTSGTLLSFILLLIVSVPVGVMTRETNFMLTNILLATFFLVPLDVSALVVIKSDPIASAIALWCLLWPPVHAVLTRKLRFSPWKLAGWGMYATRAPRIDVIGPEGELLPAQAFPQQQFALLQTYGACDITWLRNYAHREFFRWCHKRPAKGLTFRWYRRLGDRYVTTCMVFPNGPSAQPTTFDLTDEASVSSFMRYIASDQLPKINSAANSHGLG